MRFNRYLPAVLLYFFFNGVLLPFGLLYTTLLTPVFLLWLFKFPIFRKLIWFFILLLPFLIVQLYNGVDTLSYIRSTTLLFTVYVFSLTCYQFFTNCESIRRIYRDITVFNAGMVILALFALAIPFARKIFWYANEITPGVHTLRLRLLTYEPSYYSTLLMPLMIYYYLKLIVGKLPDPKATFALLTVPFLLTFSFGGMLGFALALLITLLYGYRYFFNRRAILYMLIVGTAAVTALLVALIAFPHNVFVIRFTNIFNGNDSSFRGRTLESFSLGWKIAHVKSIWFGCGAGQARIAGLNIFRKFYDYPSATGVDVVIPNAVGDTFAAFGILGVALRLGLQIGFFFKTRVYSNYYRLALFLFIFIYQLTGSFITNIAEYVIWVMAFHPAIFPEFDKERFHRRIRMQRANLFRLSPKTT